MVWQHRKVDRTVPHPGQATITQLRRAWRGEIKKCTKVVRRHLWYMGVLMHELKTCEKGYVHACVHRYIWVATQVFTNLHVWQQQQDKQGQGKGTCFVVLPYLQNSYSNKTKERINSPSLHLLLVHLVHRGLHPASKEHLQECPSPAASRWIWNDHLQAAVLCLQEWQPLPYHH